jgi:hypothetical protein
MPAIVWDKPAERFYEIGLDHGVLYLNDGSGVPWNGLVSVNQSPDIESESAYYDGMKFINLISPGDFSGSMTAITYPDQFLEFEGLTQIAYGAYAANQQPKTFDLSYRTHIGNSVGGEPTDYKIHILYNVTAIPSTKNYETIGETPNVTEFSWDISAIPQEFPGIRPTAHIILDSRFVEPTLLAEIELQLYGGETADPRLPSFNALMTRLSNFFTIEIIDNKDGTWTAFSNFDAYIVMDTDDQFTLPNVDVVYIDANTYVVSDTRG